LCKKENDRFQFALVDNNRMRFKKFDYTKGLQTFKRLGLTDSQLTQIAKEYATLSNENEVKTIEKIFNIVRRHKQRNSLKKAAKKMVRNASHRLTSTISGA